jgi:uncharacterized protein (DUF2249 family)
MPAFANSVCRYRHFLIETLALPRLGRGQDHEICCDHVPVPRILALFLLVPSEAGFVIETTAE